MVKQSLDLLGQGDWQACHDIIEKLHSRASAHVHAHLHRVEGDLWNARYWYRRAGVEECTDSLSDEFNELVQLYGSID